MRQIGRPWGGCDHSRRQGAQIPPKFLANLVILCCWRRCSKRNTVARLKSKHLPQKSFWLATLLVATIDAYEIYQVFPEIFLFISSFNSLRHKVQVTPFSYEEVGLRQDWTFNCLAGRWVKEFCLRSSGHGRRKVIFRGVTADFSKIMPWGRTGPQPARICGRAKYVMCCKSINCHSVPGNVA